METGVANHFVLQQTAVTGSGQVADLMGASREITLFVIGSIAVTAGTVVLETADDPGYSGTWAQLASINVVEGQQVISQKRGCLSAVRARISVDIVGIDDTATGGSTTTIVKAAAGWTPDKYIGRTVTMTGGTPENDGLTRTITDNDTTTLTVSPAFPEPVANLDTFTINADVSVTLMAN